MVSAPTHQGKQPEPEHEAPGYTRGRIIELSTKLSGKGLLVRGQKEGLFE